MSAMVDDGGYIVYEWTFVAAAIVATLGRFAIRFFYVKAARWDDLFNGLALGALVGFMATNHIAAYYYDDSVLVLKAYLASDFLLWTTLYFVKASFLALMWSIFNVSKTFRIWWWIVSAYTLLGFLVAIVCEFWTCGSPLDFANYDICWDALNSTSMGSATPDILKIVFHLSSDFFILALPLFYIRKLQMSGSKKISVGAVFAATIIDIVTGILRNASSICVFSPATYNSQTCVDMNIITGVLEPTLAVIVCALPAYRAILPSSRKRRYESRELRLNVAHMGHASPPKRSQTTQVLDSIDYPYPGQKPWVSAEDSRAHSSRVSAHEPVEVGV